MSQLGEEAQQFVTGAFEVVSVAVSENCTVGLEPLADVEAFEGANSPGERSHFAAVLKLLAARNDG